MKDEAYWKLFWLSGMPEAWLMSRPGLGDFNIADMTLPHMGTALPEEARELYQSKAEQGAAEMSGPSLTGK